MVRDFMALSEDQQEKIKRTVRFTARIPDTLENAKERRAIKKKIENGRDPFEKKQPKKKESTKKLTEAQYMERDDELVVQVASNEGSIVAATLVHAEQQEALNKIRDREAAVKAVEMAQSYLDDYLLGPKYSLMQNSNIEAILNHKKKPYSDEELKQAFHDHNMDGIVRGIQAMDYDESPDSYLSRYRKTGDHEAAYYGRTAKQSSYNHAINDWYRSTGADTPYRFGPPPYPTETTPEDLLNQRLVDAACISELTNKSRSRDNTPEEARYSKDEIVLNPTIQNTEGFLLLREKSEAQEAIIAALQAEREREG